MNSCLINKGVQVIGEPSRESGPIVVIGVARGGTSMIAGALSYLGVYMGDESESPVFEDVLLANAIESGDFHLALQIANGYDVAHKHWGWKRPSSIDFLVEIDSVLKPYAYVFVFKDIFSIAQRNAISMLENIVLSMEMANLKYSKCIDFIKSKKPYGLLVSYEKAVAYPDNLINYLINIKQLNSSDDEVNSAIEFVQCNPAEYLDSSRVTKAEGCLDGVTQDLIFGWARFINSDEPALVEIFLNEVSIGMVTAADSRHDLDSIFAMPCAFNFRWPPNTSINNGDWIRLRVINEVTDLVGSPFELKFSELN